MGLQEMGWGMGWIHLAQERDSSCDGSDDSPVSKKCGGIF